MRKKRPVFGLFFVNKNREIMENKLNKKGRITPIQTMNILNSGGIHVTVEEAKAILEFMKKIANIAVSKYLQT